MRRPNAIVVLVLGILSIFGFGCLTGLPAWIIGNTTLREIDTLGGDPSDRTMVVVGRTIGMVVTILSIGGLLIFVAFTALAGTVTLRPSHGPTNLPDDFPPFNTRSHAPVGPGSAD